MKMAELRKELGVTSQGRVSNRDDAVLFHLAFRMDRSTAEKFIRQSAAEGVSESFWGRRAIVEKLTALGEHKQ